MEKIINWLNEIDLSRLVLSAIIIAAAVILWRLFRRVYKQAAARRARERNVKGSADTVTAVIYGVIKGIVIVGVILAVLGINGVDITAMVTGFGIASAIVGLAIQDMLRDIIMGIHIVSDNFFEVGDVIRYNGVEGQVIYYNIRTTRIRDIDTGNVMTICNRNITEVIKRSNLLLMNVPLSYEEDYRKVHRVMQEICQTIGSQEYVTECRYMGTQDFLDSAINYRINIYAPPEKKWVVWRAARTAVQEGLDAAGIRIPYQQLDIHNVTAPQIGE